jgi:ATP-binding cassette, subfamily F, member 1
LDDYLNKWKNTLLVVSHDQDFLSSVVTDIIHLEDKKLHYYRGDYDSFKAQHEKDTQKRVKDYEKQQKQLRAMKGKGVSAKHAEAAAKRRGAAAAKRGGKRGGGAAAGGGSSSGPTELLSKPKVYSVNFNFGEVPELSPPIIQVDDVSFRYSPEHPVLFKKLDFGIDQTSRVSIVGPNGVGKSTLLNLLMGYLKPTSGEIQRNRFLRIGRYNQHFADLLPMDKSPVDYLMEGFSMTYQNVSGHHLLSFPFPFPFPFPSHHMCLLWFLKPLSCRRGTCWGALVWRVMLTPSETLISLVDRRHESCSRHWLCSHHTFSSWMSPRTTW